MVTASSTGFGILVQQNVSVTIGGDVGLDFHLQVATTTTSVEVHGAASAQLITLSTAEVQTSVSNSRLSAIPVEVDSDIYSPSFGKITTMNGNPRNGQLSETLSWQGQEFHVEPLTVRDPGVRKEVSCI
jgi:hypothetical protein